MPPVDPQQQRAMQLVRAAQLGDRAAFGQIVVLYQDRLFNALLRLVGSEDDAAELCQETFTRALEKIGQFRGQSGPYTWMFRIATNLALTEMRKTQRRRTFATGAVPGNGHPDDDGGGHQAAALIQRIQSAGPSPAEQVERRDSHQQVMAALGRIDDDQRVILVMRDVDGFDYQQMADVLDVPVGTVKSRLFRARMALREELRPESAQTGADAPAD